MATGKNTLFSGALIAVTALAIGLVIASRLDLVSSSAAQTFQTSQTADAPALPAVNTAPITGPLTATTFRDIAAAQSPMVVNIRTESRRRGDAENQFFGGGGDNDELFRRFFGDPSEPSVSVSAGTGFVIDQAGYIVTNNHVIEGATKIEVSFLDDDQAYEARVVGQDPLTDSALLQLEDRPEYQLPAATFGDSSQMQAGDWVIAIGNPFSLGHTVTVGVISAVGRPFFGQIRGRSQPVIQTDAAINPGNSGGPLLNIRGEVIGVNTAIVSDRPSNLGIGFAVPSNTVRDLLPQLHTGRVTRGVIGVEILAVANYDYEEHGLAEPMGALITRIAPDGPADDSDLELGDVIVSFDGDRVNKTEDLVEKVVNTRPGTVVNLGVYRNGSPLNLTIRIGELDLDNEDRPAEVDIEDINTGFGMSLQNLTADRVRDQRLEPGTTGAIVSAVVPGGVAQTGGIVPNDVITEVNRVPVASAAEATRELNRIDSGRAALLRVVNGNRERVVRLRKE